MRRVAVDGVGEVRYELVRRPRMRSIRMVVDEGRLRVSCRPGVPLAEVEDAIRGKARWLSRHEAALSAGPPPPLADGDPLPLLGGEVELGLAVTGRDAWAFRDHDGRLCVEVAHTSGADAVVEGWYRAVALDRLGEMARRHAGPMGVEVPVLRIGSPRSRWGSCTSRGAVRLNWRLVMTPPHVAEYVVVHELAHLLHLDHSPRFWAVVDAALPGNAGAREWLRRHGDDVMRRRPRPGG